MVMMLLIVDGESESRNKLSTVSSVSYVKEELNRLIT
jgi:hypothetical protein